MRFTTSVGNAGEDAAARYLTGQGLEVVDRHFWTPLGEIDLIAREGEDWIFVEVKTRNRPEYAPTDTLESITPAKQRKLTRAALIYLKRHGLHDVGLRFDVVVIEPTQIRWLRNAFEPASTYTY